MTENSSFPRQTILITVIQIYVPTTDAKEAEVDQFYEDLQEFLEHQKKTAFLVSFL